MAVEAKFDINRDIEIVNAGGFFCKACSIGKPAGDVSPDPRYCKGCYKILVKEVELIPPNQHRRWMPKCPSDTPRLKISGTGDKKVAFHDLRNPDREIKGKSPDISQIRMRL